MIYIFMISYLYICYCHDVKDDMTHNINDNGDHRRRRYNNNLYRRPLPLCCYYYCHDVMMIVT